MAETQVTTTPDDGNPSQYLPVLVERKRDVQAERIEALTDIEKDFRRFQCDVHRQMQTYRQVLSSLTSDMYKEVFKRLVGGDTMSFSHDPLFQGWHCHGYNACDQVKNGMDDMWFALRQAKAYARAMQRPRKDGSAEANPYM